ncbi:lipoprotein [Thermosulfurimonas dismutans]|uniref:Fibronectin type III domain protein n=1 Tax=Thermosulfurimonas dismutans TaxID=999894 RepID=A0A179D6F8_9BACT|nr:hypothetical protein [Thermosulfurimonas dismutans]OAQ21032.1 Fibronectin type III domain protein [Thermosulfurimonas dismutans]
MFIRLFVLFLFISGVTGCGKKGPPLPPEAVRPEPPKDFRIRLEPFFAELSFKIPVENIRGQALSRIKAFRIEKRRYPAENPRLTMVQTLKIPFRGKLSEEERFYYRDRNLRPGFCYEYRVSAIKGFRSESDWTPPQKFCWFTPPKTPEGFEIKTLPLHQVFLTWKPVTRDLNDFALPGKPLYRIYRRSSRETRVFPPIPDNAFYDLSVQAGETYCYSVEPLLPYYGTLIPGFRTPEICARP